MGKKKRENILMYVLIGVIILLILLISFKDFTGLTVAFNSTAVTLTLNTSSSTNPAASIQSTVGNQTYTITLVSASNTNAVISVAYPYPSPCDCVIDKSYISNCSNCGPGMNTANPSSCNCFGSSCMCTQTNCLVCTYTNSSSQTINVGTSQVVNGITINLVSSTQQGSIETAVITSSSTITCSSSGQSCSSNSNCCSGLTCSNSTCIIPPITANCSSSGQSCSSNSNCCSGLTCSNSTCIIPPITANCSSSGQSCSSNSNCCSGLTCSNSTCIIPKTTNPNEITLTINFSSTTNPAALTQLTAGNQTYTITLVSGLNTSATINVTDSYLYPCDCVSTGNGPAGAGGPTNCLKCTSTNSTTQTINVGNSQTVNGVTIDLISSTQQGSIETAVITAIVSISQNCIGLGGSLGAVVPGNYAQCCPGLVAYIPPGKLGTMGTCINQTVCKSSGQSCSPSSNCCSGLICNSNNVCETTSTTSNNLTITTPSFTESSNTTGLVPDISAGQITAYNTELNINQINNVTLNLEYGKLVYTILGKKDAYLFAIIPIPVNIEQKIDADSGSVISTQKPWWSFLASGI